MRIIECPFYDNKIYLCNMIHTITSEQLVSAPGIICLENDFAICDNLSQVPHINDAFQSEMLIIIFCMNGNMQLVAGDNVVELTAGDAYLCPPLTAIHHVLSSADICVSILFYSPHIVDQLLPTRQNLSQVLEKCKHYDVHFGTHFMNLRILPLIDMLNQRALHPNLPFRSNILYHLFCTLLFEVFNHICTSMTHEAHGTSVPQTVCRADTLFNTFIKLLNEDCGRHRTVTYYADKMCITPKHLSRVIREKTHTRTLDVINGHAVRLIKLDLKLSDISIHQLADKYNFCNYSFFCQYVKSHLGMTPIEYRER